MKKVLIPLAGMPNQRDMDALQSLIEGKDQRFRNLYVIPIDNPLVGSRKVYVEKRPGFEEFLTPCPGHVGQAIFYSVNLGKFISAFGDCGVHVGETLVGETVDPSPDDFVCPPIFQTEFDNDNTDDIAHGSVGTFQSGSNHTVADGELTFEWADAGALDVSQIIYDDGDGELNAHNADEYTIEWYFWLTNGGSSSSDHGIVAIQGTSADLRIFVKRQSGQPWSRRIYFRNAIISSESDDSSIPIPTETWVHIAFVKDNTNGARLYIGGTKVIEEDTPGESSSPLPTANGVIKLGGPQTGAQTGPIKFDDVRLSPCIVYTGDTFTPPAKGSLPNP